MVYHHPMLDLDAARTPVVPRDAATVVVAREREGELQVFCVKRHARSGFMGGAVVFPGGKLAAEDRSPEWAALCTPLSSRCSDFADDADGARAFAIAALRELIEEAALLPVSGGTLDDAQAKALRDRLAVAADDDALLRSLLRERALTLDTGRLAALARWVTPAAESRRYDTRFYFLPLTEDQAGLHDAHETTQSFWASPSAVLAMWERGEAFLAPPTSRTLELLAPAKDVAAALAIVRGQSLAPICPHFAMEGERAVLALPGDPLHPDRSWSPWPEGPSRFEMVDGRFVPRRAE